MLLAEIETGSFMLDNVRRDFRTHGHSFGHAGFWALAVYRFGRWSMQRRSARARWFGSCVYSPLRAITQLVTGVMLERETEIGDDLHIVHPGMISIHPRAVIGNRVGIMHGVTLGTNMGDEAPIIGDDVFIGCHASVLGNVTIGSGARISANSLVITDVPPHGVAIGVPAKTTTLGLGLGIQHSTAGKNGRSS